MQESNDVSKRFYCKLKPDIAEIFALPSERVYPAYRNLAGGVTIVIRGASYLFNPSDVEEWEDKSMQQNNKVPKKTSKVKTRTKPCQRKVTIMYSTGEKYHLKNVINFVVDNQEHVVHITYVSKKDGTDFRINFTLPFSELYYAGFKDVPAKKEIDYYFIDSKLAWYRVAKPTFSKRSH